MFKFFFQRLSSVSPKLAKEHCEAALLPENRKKNRNSEIYPCRFLATLENLTLNYIINKTETFLKKNYF